MNKQILETLLNWPKSYIFGADLCQLLNKSPDSRYGIIKRAIREGHLVPIRRDLYLIKCGKKPVVDAFEIAAILYGPSYISFESALSIHGWIPEGVFTTTSATTKRTKEFETSLGPFSYEHIPIEIFRFGVEQRMQKETTLFIAHPIKALADMIYARKKQWNSIQEIGEDLRIESESLNQVDRTLLQTLIDCYPSKRVQKILRSVQNGIKS